MYSLTWRNKWLTAEAENIDGMIEALEQAVLELKAMRDDGIVLHPGPWTVDDYAMLITKDPVIARKHGFDPFEIFNGSLG